MRESYVWGVEAEQIALEYLVRKGMPIREKRWRAGGRGYELDIISQQGNAILFIEVKARSNDEEDPAEAIDEKKIRRIVRAADTYLQTLEHLWAYRFDVILITGTPENYTIEYIEEAFMPPLNVM